MVAYWSNLIKYGIIKLIFLISGITYSQSAEENRQELTSNKSLHTAFNQFYKDSIIKETKDEWGDPYYYKIDVVHGLNYFDYNDDGVLDALIEFSVHPSDSYTTGYQIAVLFKNEGETYSYEAHLLSGNMNFISYSFPIFLFSGKVYYNSESSSVLRYKLIDKKFVMIKNR